MFTTPKHTGRSSLGGITPLSSSFLGRRSLQPTPKTTPSIATRSVRAEHILEESEKHVVRELNYPVPVQVQEALRTNLKTASINLHDSGWAWLVVGTRLLLWRYSAHQLTVQCYQLSLTDSSGWHSDLITVCSPTSDTQLSLLACSPSGHMSYWSNVLRDASVTVEGVVDTGEGVVFSVSSLPGEIGCLVATSNSTLFLIALSSPTGLSIRQLQPPHSMLSGFSRRMSSLFFGAQESGEQEVQRVSVSSLGTSTGLAFILTSTNLQKWVVNASGEQLLYDVELVPLVKSAVLENSWLDSSATENDITVWIIDMQMSGGSMAVLFALYCQGTPTAEHGLALIKSTVDTTPVSLDSVLRLHHSINCPAGQEHLLCEYCLHGTPFSTAVMMYDKNMVLLADIQCSSVEHADVINFPQPNCILGSGSLNGNLLFFTLHHGIVAISQTSVSTAKTAVATAPRHHSLLVPTPTLTPNPMPSPFSTPSLPTPEACSDATEAIKNAFSLYLEGNMVNACSTCEQHFPPQSFATRLDTQGDLAVICLSHMVLDDPPPSVDPDSPGGGGSLILIYRLEEKFQAHARYVQFLIDVGMMDRLTCVRVRGHPMPTRLVLCEHAEKIQAAITLRRMHNPVVDQAVKLVLQRRPPSPYLSLTKNDVFYTHVSKLEDIFPALLACQEEVLHSMESAQERVELILNVSSLLDSTLRDAVVYRQSKGTLYQVCSDENVDPEFVAWTASEGERGNRHCISEQLQVIVEVGVHEVQRQQDQRELWSVYFSLSDLLYDGYSTQLSSLQNLPAMKSRLNEVRKKFEAVRQRFLTPLLEHGQLQHVTELAEKYKDFPVLIQLCEELNNKMKLKEYMSLFAAQGFSEFLFKHYLDQCKFHKLLSFSTDFPQELSAFLEPHDNLSWIHHISVQDYSKAHTVLHEMSRKEAQYVGKKKTLLSLGKLAALASGGRSESVQEIDTELQYIAYQQNLPKEVIEIDDGDPETMPPLSPQKIVELYVGESNPNSEVRDFFAALEFIDFIHNDENDSEIEELRVYIWGQAVLKDDWTQLSTDDPLNELQKTFFFKIVEEAFKNDMDMLALLPNIISLMSCPQLVEAGLQLEPGFQFLMKAGYEQVERVQSH